MMMGSCREDDMVINPGKTDVEPTDTTQRADSTDSVSVQSPIALYILCEGNMGSNKATLDYLDLSAGSYLRNIYPSRNPNKVMELGDVGNDIKIYGSKLWMVINCSNKVEVADKNTAISTGHIDIPNCRFLAFDRGYAYVSSYVGPVSGSSVLGAVYKVDTLTLKVTDSVAVGYQPEEMAVSGRNLYVANSGGYNAMEGKPYDDRVSIIDLDSFKVKGSIRVAPNLFRLRADRQGRIWVSSRGDYASNPSRLYMIEHDEVADSVDIPVSDMAFRGDSIYYIGTTWDNTTWESTANYGIIDTGTRMVVNQQPVSFPDGRKAQTPYGINVNPANGDIYIMDATNYVSSGKLWKFSADGTYQWDTSTGDIPGHSCWLYK